MGNHEFVETKDGYQIHFVYHDGGMVVRIAREGTEIAAHAWQASDANHERAADWARVQIRSHRKAIARLKRT